MPTRKFSYNWNNSMYRLRMPNDQTFVRPAPPPCGADDGLHGDPIMDGEFLGKQQPVPSVFGYASMTPDPTSSSPSYHAANCPGVIPRWGVSKSRKAPDSRMMSRAPCNGWR